MLRADFAAEGAFRTTRGRRGTPCARSSALDVRRRSRAAHQATIGKVGGGLAGAPALPLMAAGGGEARPALIIAAPALPGSVVIVIALVPATAGGGAIAPAARAKPPATTAPASQAAIPRCRKRVGVSLEAPALPHAQHSHAQKKTCSRRTVDMQKSRPRRRGSGLRCAWPTLERDAQVQPELAERQAHVEVRTFGRRHSDLRLRRDRVRHRAMRVAKLGERADRIGH